MTQHETQRVALKPATPEQTAIWFYERMHEANPAYNISVAFTFDRRLDSTRLQHAFDILVMRHSALRLRFTLEGGGLRQYVSTEVAPRLQVALADQAPAGKSADQLMAQEIRRPFDITAEPLVRLLLIRSQRQDTLVLSVHHIVSDGQSVEILLRDLAAAYNGKLDCAAAAQAGTQFIDHAACLAIAAGAKAPGHEYWQRYLEGADLSLFGSLQTDSPQQPAQKRRYVVAGPDGQHLSALAHQLGCPRHLVLLTALCLSLSQRYASQDFALITPLTLRNVPEREQLVGLLLKFLPLRCRIADQQNFEATLEALRNEIFELLDRTESFSWDHIRNPTLLRRSYLLGSPLEIMYTATDNLRNQLILDGEAGQERYLDNGTSKTALTCMVGSQNNDVTVTFQWDVRFLTAQDIEGLWVGMMASINSTSLAVESV